MPRPTLPRSAAPTRPSAASVARRSPDLGGAIRANRDLHFAVYRAARLPSLVAIIEGLWLCIGPILNLDIRSSPARLRMGAAEAAHGRLLVALEARDGSAARAGARKRHFGCRGLDHCTGRIAAMTASRCGLHAPRRWSKHHGVD